MREVIARIVGQFQQRVHWHTLSGAATVVQHCSVTPQSSVLVIRLPWGWYTWQRPSAVVIEERGHRWTIPIVDVTRRIELSLSSVGLLVFALIHWRLRRRDKGATDERS